MKPKCKILIIAGSDSSGGAGVQADIKTATALGGYAMTAITSITAQNTTGVKSVFPINSKEVEKQIIYTCKDIKPDVVKIGMIYSKQVAISIFKSLKKLKIKKIILDPVMVAKGGFKLIDKKAINFIKDKLMKNVTLITPNIPETEVLTKIKIKNTKDMTKAGEILIKGGVKNVLIKGGHSNTERIYDILYSKNGYKKFVNKKIKTKNTHGTGCTLSTAIATFYGCGKTLNKSCELGIKYVNQSIKTNPKYGKGNGPINHLSSIKIIKFRK